MKRIIMLLLLLTIISCNDRFDVLVSINPKSELKSPANSYYVTDETDFTWKSVVGSTYYIFQISRDPGGLEVVIEEKVSTTTYRLNSSQLKNIGDNFFYWRVKSEFGDFTEANAFVVLANDTIYVNNSYSGTELFGSKDKPFADINNAIIKAANIGVTQVYVATGTYSGLINLDCGLLLKGGFSVSNNEWTYKHGERTTLTDCTIFSVNCDTESSVENFNVYGNSNLLSAIDTKLFVNDCSFSSNEGGFSGTINVEGTSNFELKDSDISSINETEDKLFCIKLLNSVTATITGCSIFGDANYSESASDDVGEYSTGIEISGYSIATITNNTILAEDGKTIVSAINQADNSKTYMNSNTSIGSKDGEEFTLTITLNDNSYSEIENNKIYCEGSSRLLSCIDVALNSEAIVRNNTEIKSEGMSETSTTGISVQENGKCTIEGNKIISQLGMAIVSAIRVSDYSEVDIINNPEIIAASSEQFVTTINLTGTCQSLIENNYIYGNNAPTLITGIQIGTNKGSVLIRNNPIIRLSGTTTVGAGINIARSDNVIIANNNIDGGNGYSNLSCGLSMQEITKTHIINNIFFTTGGNQRIGMMEVDTESDPTRLENNLFFACPDTYYLDEKTIKADPSVTQVAPICGGNIVDINPYFVDRNAEPPDMHLQLATSDSVKYGGKELCGNSELGDVCLDADDNVRTAPISIGPYEQE